MAAACMACTMGRSVGWSCGHMSPFVVTSSRFSGPGDMSGRNASGRWLHLGVAAIQGLRRLRTVRAQQFQVLSGCVRRFLAQVTVIHRPPPSSCQQRQVTGSVFLSPKGLAHIGDVIDIHAKAGHGRESND